MTVDYLYFTLEDGAKAPERSSDDAAGYDLFASEDVAIRPLETVLVPTGIRMAMPPGMEAQVRPRSGLSLRTTLRIANAPGTIDADYRGMVGIICQNLLPLTDPVAVLVKYPELAKDFSAHYTMVSAADYFERETGQPLPLGLTSQKIAVDQAGYPLGTYFIRKGERIAQLVFTRPVFPSWRETSTLEGIGRDRGGGFGSTGL
jgi:dUTP pyrophosphatase